MKYIVLVPDGMADYPIADLDGKTPLEVAKIPNMQYFAKNGKVGMVKNVPDKMEPGSDVANLSLFGYDPRKYYTGRAPLEAASLNVTLAPNEVAFRCNFVTEDHGVMADYSAGHISSNEAKALIAALNKGLKKYKARFIPGVSYRHILVLQDENGLDGLSAKCIPPHDFVGKPIDKYYPKGVGADRIKEIILASKEILAKHEINTIRLDLQENPANLIWLWGQGVMPKLDKFKDKWGISGSVISAVDLIKGIGKIVGLDVINVPGATGYVDTNYDGKIEAALKSLEKDDFTFVHIEAPDEAGHEGKLKLKISAIEAFDFHVVGKVRKYCETHDNVKVVIAPDHATPIAKRTHTRDMVPFIMFGKNVVKDENECFSEAATKFSSWKIEEGHMLMHSFID